MPKGCWNDPTTALFTDTYYTNWKMWGPAGSFILSCSRHAGSKKKGILKYKNENDKTLEAIFWGVVRFDVQDSGVAQNQTKEKKRKKKKRNK